MATDFDTHLKSTFLTTYYWLCRTFDLGSDGLREILRAKNNPIEKMDQEDVKPLLQAALTMPNGEKLVDLEDQGVSAPCIIEGEESFSPYMPSGELS